MRRKTTQKVYYLLLHFAVPSRVIPPRTKKDLHDITIIGPIGRKLGITINICRLTINKRMENYCFIFHYPKYEKNDDSANVVGETLVNSILFLYPYTSQINNFEITPFFVYCIPSKLIKNYSIAIEDIAKYEDTKPYEERSLEFVTIPFSNLRQVPKREMNAALKILPIILNNKNLRTAISFLVASEKIISFAPGDIQPIIDNPSLSARNSFEQTNNENAYINAYKSIEAIIGDPPKKDDRLFQKMRSIGLDPNKLVGYTTKEPLFSAIRRMNLIRDKNSAHGSNDHKILSLKDILEVQSCAHYILCEVIEIIMADDIYP